MSAAARANGGAGLAAGATIGSFTLTAPLWRLPVADAFRATGPDAVAFLHDLLHQFGISPCTLDVDKEETACSIPL